MKSIKSALSHLSHKSTPVVASNMSVDAWYHHLRAQPTRFVTKIEICTAAAAGDDVWGDPVDKAHFHTLLRVFLMPTSVEPGVSEDVFLIERVLSTGGAHHSVTPIPETFPTGGTLFHPDVHDRICAISKGPSTALAHRLEVERTVMFGSGSSEPLLTLTQLAQILEFVSRTTMMVCAGGDCQFQSRSFSFTCMAALTPTLPPSTLVREGGRNVTSDAEGGADMVNDSMVELAAETFFMQIPWLVRDEASMQALSLIRSLKEEPQPKKVARLYH